MTASSSLGRGAGLELDQIVHCLALALGGRPAASFSLRWSISVSKDTLLCAMRKRGNPSFAPRRSSATMIGPGAAAIAMER